MLQHETEHNNNYASELKQLKQNNLSNLPFKKNFRHSRKQRTNNTRHI